MGAAPGLSCGQTPWNASRDICVPSARGWRSLPSTWWQTAALRRLRRRGPRNITGCQPFCGEGSRDPIYSTNGSHGRTPLYFAAAEGGLTPSCMQSPTSGSVGESPSAARSIGLMTHSYAVQISSSRRQRWTHTAHDIVFSITRYPCYTPSAAISRDRAPSSLGQTRSMFLHVIMLPARNGDLTEDTARNRILCGSYPPLRYPRALPSPYTSTHFNSP